MNQKEIRNTNKIMDIQQLKDQAEFLQEMDKTFYKKMLSTKDVKKE